jgi:hypothetical protein
MVFTFVSQRSLLTTNKLNRRPITRHGVQTYWRRLRLRAGVEGFRFH